MSKFIFVAVCSIALLAELSLFAPSTANAATHRQGTSRSSVQNERRASVPVKSHNPPTQLSNNAYWKAATSPNPPNTGGNQNLASQKYFAWKDYQDRIKK
jgi:hypothetical protein